MYALPQRPKKGETEEDLLRLQEEFEARGEKKTVTRAGRKSAKAEDEGEEISSNNVMAKGKMKERNPLVCLPPKPPCSSGTTKTPFPEVFKAEEDDESQR